VHVLGVQPWLSLEAYADSVPQNWTWLSFAPTLLAALFGTLAYVRWWLLPVVGILWAGLTLTTDSADIDVRDGGRSFMADPFNLQALPSDARLGADPVLGQAVNIVTFYAGSRGVDTVSADEAPESVDVLFTRFFVTAPEDDGARQIAVTDGTTIHAWVYPGEVQDQLAREGLLVEVP